MLEISLQDTNLHLDFDFLSVNLTATSNESLLNENLAFKVLPFLQEKFKQIMFKNTATSFSNLFFEIKDFEVRNTFCKDERLNLSDCCYEYIFKLHFKDFTFYCSLYLNFETEYKVAWLRLFNHFSMDREKLMYEFELKPARSFNFIANLENIKA